MSYVNKVILVGNLGKDPDSCTMSNGKKVLNFPLATSEFWVDRNTNERVSKTEWHNVVVFNEQIISSLLPYMKKGSKVYIEGSLRTRKWVDSGRNERYTTEVVLQGYGAVLRLLDGKKGDSTADNHDPGSYNQDFGPSSGSRGGGGQPISTMHTNALEDELSDDEIPF